MHRCGGLGADKEIDVFPFMSAGSYLDLHQNGVRAAFNLQSAITATDHSGIVEDVTISRCLILNELFESCPGINGVLDIYGIFVSLNAGIQKFKSSFPLMRVPDISFSGTTEVELEYQCREQGEYVLAGEEQNNGFIIRKYSIAPENEVITGYLVQCWENDKVVKSIRSSLTPSLNHTFGFRSEENIDTRVVTVPGMEKALWITRNGRTTLRMIRKLEQPVTVKAAPESSAGESDGTIVYEYELITVSNFTFDECEQYFQASGS